MPLSRWEIRKVLLNRIEIRIVVKVATIIKIAHDAP